MVALGAHTGQQNLTMDELRALWRRLDQTLDWISVWDHIYEVPPAGGTSPHFESLTSLGALCADTTNARIGCLVFYVGYRNPALLAKAATTLDHISGGRFELGLGAGWAEFEATAYGYAFPPLGDRFAMLEEALPMVRSLFTEAHTTHTGAHYRTDAATNLPAPVRGSIPVWVGGTGPKRTPRLAAAYADGWNVPYVSPATFAALNSRIDEACERIGRDPQTLERSVNVLFHLATDGRTAADVEAELRTKWASMSDTVDVDEIVGGALMGAPAEAAAKIDEYVAAGADGVNIALRAPIDAEALEAYLTEVVPAVRAAHG